MTEAEKTKLLIHKNTLQKMLIKEAINQHKAEYEALDYAIELIKKELGEVES